VNCAELDAADPDRDMGVHDPRLWSNLRGGMALESAAERLAAHGRLDCREGQGAADALREGFFRHGSARGVPLPFAALFGLFLVLCAWRGFVAGRRGKRTRYRVPIHAVGHCCTMRACGRDACTCGCTSCTEARADAIMGWGSAEPFQAQKNPTFGEKRGGCGVRGCPNPRPHSHALDLARRLRERR
jgi:hypothetical protein